MSHSYLFDWDIGLFFHSSFFFVWYFQAVIFMSDWKRYQAYSSLVDVFWHLAEKEKKVWWYGLYFTHRWPERRGLHETCNVPMTWFRSPPKIYSFRRNKVIAHQALHTNYAYKLNSHSSEIVVSAHCVVCRLSPYCEMKRVSRKYCVQLFLVSWRFLNREKYWNPIGVSLNFNLLHFLLDLRFELWAGIKETCIYYSLCYVKKP